MSALALGVAYMAIIGLYVPIGAPPGGTEARLAYLAGHTAVWWAILATAFVALFVFLDLALT